MVERFDRVLLAVPELAGAIAQYSALLGTAPAMVATGTGEVAWWLLPNTVIEVRAAAVAAGIQGLVFAHAGAAEDEVPCANALGLQLSTGNGASTAACRETGAAGLCDTLTVDHVVLRTSSADACVSLFRDTLGIRLALDQTVPQWGGRMLFFRAGKLTLEVIEAQAGSDGGERDGFWGIAYQCADIDDTVAAMAGRGVSVSPVREGRKPGTRVATVKSHCLDIPTLLIEPAAAM